MEKLYHRERSWSGATRCFVPSMSFRSTDLAVGTAWTTPRCTWPLRMYSTVRPVFWESELGSGRLMEKADEGEDHCASARMRKTHSNDM